MTQIRLIKLGLIAVCLATLPLSLAQTPRTGTSASNKTGATARPTAGLSGSSGNYRSVTQFGTNSRSSTSTAPNTNVGAHIGINAGAQSGISNSTGGITGVAAGLPRVSNSNSTGATQAGTNFPAAATANANAETHTAAAAAPARATTF